ncbi:MAG: anti-sigma factor antagonist [Nitrospirales bacterium]|nr:MAG: anti-sigma factor antagonist [Nitrospirales bacterium]
MEHSVHVQPNGHIVSFSGEIDLENSPAARTRLLEVVEYATTVFVDLTAVTYMDSSGIASLVEAYQRAKKTNVAFVLISTSPAVLRVLQMARLDKVFTIHETLEHAQHAKH